MCLDRDRILCLSVLDLVLYLEVLFWLECSSGHMLVVCIHRALWWLIALTFAVTCDRDAFAWKRLDDSRKTVTMTQLIVFLWVFAVRGPRFACASFIFLFLFFLQNLVRFLGRGELGLGPRWRRLRVQILVLLVWSLLICVLAHSDLFYVLE